MIKQCKYNDILANCFTVKKDMQFDAVNEVEFSAAITPLLN